MKNVHFKPLVVLYGHITGSNRIAFIGRKGSVVLDGNLESITAILKLCNGRRTIDDIRQKIGIDQSLFDALVAVLVDNGIIIDGCSLYTIFHSDSSNPMLFHHNLNDEEIRIIGDIPRRAIDGFLYSLPKADSHLLSLIRSRKSVRAYKRGAMSKLVFSGFLESMYKTGKTKSVPSGGGLYPLSVYVALLQDVEDLSCGLYWYDSEKGAIVRMNRELDRKRLSWILDSETVTTNALGVVFVTANIKKTTEKYANRGYRLVMLEAGHVAQNAYLYCAESGFGTVEWGGFNDLEAARILGLTTPNEIVVTTMIFGLPDEKFHPSRKNDSSVLEKALVGAEKPVLSLQSGTLSMGAYTAPLVVARARYKPFSKYATKDIADRSFAFGKGVSTSEAKVKAIAEAFERYASGAIRIDRSLPESDIDLPILDLCNIAPVKRDYVVGKDVQFRERHTKWGWVMGTRLLTGENLYIPVDQVFYPVYRGDVGHAPHYFANSSGVAAHYDRNLAIENAAMELVERDAIATLWYGKRVVSAIPLGHSSVDAVRERILFWKTQSKRVKILNITTDTVPVVLVLISGQSSPCLVSGAAAAYSFADAVGKAFDEAEIMLLSWQNTTRCIENPEAVVSARDHGLLYFTGKYISMLNWLFLAEEEDESRVFYTDGAGFLEKIDPVVVDMTPQETGSVESGLTVVRVLSEKLMPLTFGYGNEHIEHPRISVLSCSWAWKYPAFPHFFS